MSRTDHHRPWKIRAADTIDRVGYFRHCEWWHGRHGECHPDWCRWWMTHGQLSGVPRWYTHNTWHRPERRRERDTFNSMKKEHRANGDIDADFGNWQHRHDGQWHWW